MSQPSTDLEFDSPEFAESFESSFDEPEASGRSGRGSGTTVSQTGIQHLYHYVDPILRLPSRWHDHHVCGSRQIQLSLVWRNYV